MSAGPRQLDPLRLPLPCVQAVRLGVRGERVVPAKRRLKIRMIVIRLFSRRDERELHEVHGVVALPIDLRQRAGERLSTPRRQADLVGVHVHEPVGIQRRRDCLLALEERAPGVLAVARKVFDLDEPATGELRRNRDRPICRAVVDEIHVDAVAHQVFEAGLDEALFVERRQNRYDAHRTPGRRSGPYVKFVRRLLPWHGCTMDTRCIKAGSEDAMFKCRLLFALSVLC